MILYMDVCCYNRPMDDQTQDRIRFEAEAILQILSKCEKEGWILVGSNVIEYELGKHTDKMKQQEAYKFFNYANIVYNINNCEDASSRAKQFQSYGVGSIDSLHLVMSEWAGAGVLLTTDDQFINSAKRTDSKVRVINPILWLMEVSADD